MGGFVFPFCLLFNLGLLRIDACKLSGRARLQGAYTHNYGTWDLCLQCPAPTMSLSWPLLAQETLQDLQVGLAQILMESLLCLGTQCTWNLVCTLQGRSLCFHQSCGAPALKPCWPSIPNALEVPLPKPDPQTQEPDMGFGTLAPMQGPLWYSYNPVRELPTWQVWVLLILQKCPSYHLIVPSLSSDVGYLLC